MKSFGAFGKGYGGRLKKTALKPFGAWHNPFGGLAALGAWLLDGGAQAEREPKKMRE